MLETNLLDVAITDAATVGQLIPQKAPIVMVDKLFFYSDTKVQSGLTIKADNFFTRNGIFTEPGLIEHMAQTVALHTGYQYFLKNQPAPVGYIGAIKKVEIQKLPKPGDELMTTAQVLHEFMDVTLVEIKVVLNNEEIASANMKTVIA